LVSAATARGIPKYAIVDQAPFTDMSGAPISSRIIGVFYRIFITFQ
jgi:hypothetical protein